MRAIDSSHKITPKGSLVKKIQKNFLPDHTLHPPLSDIKKPETTKIGKEEGERRQREARGIFSAQRG